MRRPGQYGDAGLNPMMAAQMQQMSAQRMQYNSGVGHFPERADEEHQYMSSKAEGHWKWDRDGPKGSKPMSPHIYREGQVTDASQSEYQGEILDSKMGLEKQMGRDSRVQALQADVEVGFEDNNHPQTFEGLEEKFLKDIMKLTKEQKETEDKENARHRERLNEINAQYEEKLVAIRALQATRRDEFLQKESQTRHQQYQHASMSSYHSNAGPTEAYGYGSAAAAAAAAAASASSAHEDPHQAFGRGNFDSYRERPEFVGGARNREFDSHGQYPGGRAYTSGGRYY